MPGLDRTAMQFSSGWRGGNSEDMQPWSGWSLYRCPDLYNSEILLTVKTDIPCPFSLFPESRR